MINEQKEIDKLRKKLVKVFKKSKLTRRVYCEGTKKQEINLLIDIRTRQGNSISLIIINNIY